MTHLNNLRARMRQRPSVIRRASPWPKAWGPNATADGLRIWEGARLEGELHGLKWARRALHVRSGSTRTMPATECRICARVRIVMCCGLLWVRDFIKKKTRDF